MINIELLKVVYRLSKEDQISEDEFIMMINELYKEPTVIRDHEPINVPQFPAIPSYPLPITPIYYNGDTSTIITSDLLPKINDNSNCNGNNKEQH